jgi:transposase
MVRVFVHASPTDLRRGFDGLAAMVQTVFGEDPLSGHWFVFFNRRGDRVKVLFWDRTGYCLYYKRLEAGVFHSPPGNSETVTVEIDTTRLLLILEGIELHQVKRRKRYVRR